MLPAPCSRALGALRGGCFSCFYEPPDAHLEAALWEAEERLNLPAGGGWRFTV